MAVVAVVRARDSARDSASFRAVVFIVWWDAFSVVARGLEEG